jgi:hypothetical protein
MRLRSRTVQAVEVEGRTQGHQWLAGKRARAHAAAAAAAAVCDLLLMQPATAGPVTLAFRDTKVPYGECKAGMRSRHAISKRKVNPQVRHYTRVQNV